jgi:hypothetical protein
VGAQPVETAFAGKLVEAIRGVVGVHDRWREEDCLDVRMTLHIQFNHHVVPLLDDAKDRLRRLFGVAESDALGEQLLR